jgi:nucleotide-binding universal stress UspA family protein
VRRINEVYEKILVPLDGSELAEVALPYAGELAGRLGSEVTLIHVCESTEEQYHNMHQIYIRKMAESTKQLIKKYVEKSDAASIAVKAELLYGHTAEQILNFAEKESIDLIVIATLGRSGIKRWVLGNVADKVVNASKQPVLLIRASGVHHHEVDKVETNKILLTLDAQELANKLKAEVILFQVVPPPSPVITIPGETMQIPYTPAQVELWKIDALAYLEKIADEFKSRHIKISFEVRVGDTAQEIITAADEVKADLVAMSTHGRSGIRRWALGSTADKVLHGGNTSLFLVRAQAA